MTFSRLFATAMSAMALGSITLPSLALAQTDPSAATPAPAAAAPAPQALPASPNLIASGDIVSTLQASGHFTLLVKALDAANLTAVLKTTPQLTLFAPTDEALRALPSAELTQLMDVKNAATLQKLLTYHLVHLDLDTSKIKGAKGPVQTVEGSNIEVDGSGSVLKVNDADIIQPDVHATNGYIQVIDKVLVPTNMVIPGASASITAPNAPVHG